MAAHQLSIHGIEHHRRGPASRAQIAAAAHTVAVQVAARIQRQPVFTQHRKPLAGGQLRHQLPARVARALGGHRVAGRGGCAAPGIGLITQASAHHRVIDRRQIERHTAPCH